MLSDDTKDAHELDTISWNHFVSELAVDSDNKSARHLTSWDQLRRLLQFKRLLIEELALFGDNPVWVERASASLITERCCGICALSASLCATKAILKILTVCVVAGRALPGDLCRLDGRATGRGDNTWYAYELANELGLQVSENTWVLVRVDLNLPAGHGVTCTARDRLMVIVLVDFLCSCFQNGNQGLRVVPHEHSQALIEV